MFFSASAFNETGQPSVGRLTGFWLLPDTSMGIGIDQRARQLAWKKNVGVICLV
jgi:hypothetical protein